ncbi:MAG: hypothetical protein JWQ02_3042 [Capsulimonas sp.]|jgi:hypothetical protein|nr:hypothetical protein [Capsulimonas sp.]
MQTNITSLKIVLGAAILVAAFPSAVHAQQAHSATERLNQLGPENTWLAPRVGRWDVTETQWKSPGAAPIITHAVAERKMIGSFLQETLFAVSGPRKVLRMDYLSFDRVEGRWKYVSMDMRVPVGLMPAASYGREQRGLIAIQYDPFAVAGDGVNVSGQMLRMQANIVRQDANHDRKDQYFIMSDGSGKRWLAHQYTYTRRS